MIKDIICIIPARGGSIGIPNKNLKIIGDIPLISHSIRSALKAGLSKVVVSSDSAAILDVARDENADVIERPPDLATADASTESAMIHVLNNVSNNYEHILLLQPTSPFRFLSTIHGFIDFYLRYDYDSALTVTKFYNFFWQWKRERWESSYNVIKRPMRQHLAPSDFRFFDNGNMYLTRIDILKKTKSRLGGHVGIYPISELEGMQIDTPRDLEICQAIGRGIYEHSLSRS